MNDLLEASASGDVKKVRELLEKDSSLKDKQHSINGWTALHWAAKRSHPQIVKLLLKYGADMNIQTNDGKTARDLTDDQDIFQSLGGVGDSITRQPKEHLVGFTPSYLKYPQIPSYTVEVQQAVQPYQAQEPLQPKQYANQNAHEVVLKIRVANSEEKDFIEVELEMQNRSIKRLKDLFCEELGINPESIVKIRKLPNTVIRNDKDVMRLQDFQELEAVCFDETKVKRQSTISVNSGVFY